MNPAWPSDDMQAWETNPEHRWLYCRLALAQRTGLRAAPAGIEPDTYPVIWRPTINLWGMGRGAFIAHEVVNYQPGMFWSELLTGHHVSTDAVVEGGKVVWTAQALGVGDGPQRFQAWFLGDAYRAELSAVAAFVRAELANYSGPLNVETIGARIIEAHLRLSADWVQAGAYDAYPEAPARMIGVPVFSPAPPLPSWARVTADDGDPRHAFVTVPVPPPHPQTGDE